jgi:SAM-dependent methyltransferase
MTSGMAGFVQVPGLKNTQQTIKGGVMDTNQASTSQRARTERSRTSLKWDLILASFLVLFMEVMFIRWVPSYERVLAYFTNFVLLAAFLGLGLGAMLTRWRRNLMTYQGPLILLLVVAALTFDQFVKTASVDGDVFYTEWARETLFTLKLHHCLVFFFLLIAIEFVPLGQRIGKDLKAYRPALQGYILNLVGSLAGVVAFAVVAYFQLSPGWWFGAAGVGLLWFVRHDRSARWLTVLSVGLATTFVVLAGNGYIWSPYHKLSVSPLAVDLRNGVMQPYQDQSDNTHLVSLPDETGFHIAVDNDFLQMALDLRPETIERFPFLENYQSQYMLPFSFSDNVFEEVLIVGAGTGNDTAAALRHGAQHIDAVEIDPALVQLGRDRHPQQPYSDPRVNVVIDDARSFFNRTTREYDMVIFGLLDSHRLFSGMSSVRLDSFVFTVESLKEVRRLLKPDGLVVLSHGLGAPFMGSRMFHMMNEAFGTDPVVMRVPEFPGVTYIAGPGLDLYFSGKQQVSVPPAEKATDDWPFFYLAGREFPREYKLALATMLIASCLAVFGVSGGRMRRVNIHFFFLGSAFLLIETLSITRFAMLFGSTWMINSIVFSAILIVVLLANLLMSRMEAVNIHLLYAALGLAVMLNFVFPIHGLLRVALPVRLAVAMILMGAPLFVAAFIFARSYKTTPDPDLAFGSNLLGAVVGGLAEYFSLIIGFKSLLLVALAMYFISYLALLRPATVSLPQLATAD